MAVGGILVWDLFDIGCLVRTFEGGRERGMLS